MTIYLFGWFINLHLFLCDSLVILVQVNIRLVDADDGLVQQSVCLLDVLGHHLKVQEMVLL